MSHSVVTAPVMGALHLLFWVLHCICDVAAISKHTVTFRRVEGKTLSGIFL